MTDSTEVLYEFADGDWGVTLQGIEKKIRFSDLSAANQSFIRFLVEEEGLPKFQQGAELPWHVGNPTAMDVPNVASVQADGHELSFALRALDLDPNDHNPRVQTFVGPAAKKIARAMAQR